MLSRDRFLDVALLTQTTRRCPHIAELTFIFRASVVALMSLACASRAQERSLSPEAAAKWARDSTEYQQRLARWLRDSTVIDSIARTIGTDSLAHLYEEMISSKHPEVQLQLVSCEQERLGRRYGTIAVLRVDARVRDSVYATAGGKATKDMRERMPSQGLISGRVCGPADGPVGPSVLDGTPLHTGRPKPRPPRRPDS